MKKFITSLMTLPIILLAEGQPGPALTDVLCPGTVTFHYTMTGSISDFSGATATGTTIPSIGGSQAVQSIGPVSLSSGGTSVVWTFTGTIQDWAAPQGIILSWTDINAHQQTITYHYDQIASYHTTGSPGAIPQPSPSTIQAPIAQITTVNVSVPTLNYKDYYISPTLSYGSVTNFQYLLPAGWKLGATVSDGTTWINGTGAANFTSDACTGGSILVRGVTCTAGLTPGPQATILISRPAPTFTVGASASGPFCTGDTRVFSVNSLPPGATVAWSASPAGIVTINSPSATTTTLTRTGDGLVTLTAAITVCGNNYAASSSAVTVGSPAPTDIAKGPGTSSDVEVTCSAVPGATSYNWLMNGTAMTGQHSTECDMFPVRCKQTILACVSAVNVCGTSPNYCESITNTPCLGGFSAFAVSPNPASSTIKVSMAPNTSSRTEAAGRISSFSEIRLYDQQGNLRQSQQYRNVSQTSIDVSKQPAGTYFIEIVSGSYVERQMILIRK